MQYNFALEKLNSLYDSHQESSLLGRYVHIENILPLIDKLSDKCKIELVGKSVEGEPIHSITIGSGSKKILMWSQMHGNESTSTKAIFDLLNTLKGNDEQVEQILKACTIKIIPMLNPDGAKAYTRLNANLVDLNRDAQALSQPESRALRAVFKSFNPDFCFNLHGQRTIFSAGKTNLPATLSFLAPAQDEQCSISSNRKTAMRIICKMNNALHHEIPNQIGIYDDAFNLNCVGDTFQNFGVPTILFEAGHYKNDYSREEVRRLFFLALMEGVWTIATNLAEELDYRAYFEIPMNEKLYYDVVFRNVLISSGSEQLLDVAFRYKERCLDGKIEFVPKIESIGRLEGYFGHLEINGEGAMLSAKDKSTITLGYENDFVLLNNELFSLKP